MTHRLSRFAINAHEDPAVHYMPLHLTALSDHEVLGIYGKSKTDLPVRMRYLHPDAAASYDELHEAGVQVSDMFRSAESSLRARRERRGAQRPAYSGHNYGFSIDLAVSATMRRMKLRTKRQLDEWMAEHGWHCHRRDHRRKFEEWHYNFFGNEFGAFVRDSDRRTSAGLERKITTYYGKWWTQMSATSVQRCLTRLGMYDGDLDGKIGDLTREAVRVFQRAWLLDVDGKPGPMTKRTLAYVTAARVAV